MILPGWYVKFSQHGFLIRTNNWGEIFYCSSTIALCNEYNLNLMHIKLIFLRANTTSIMQLYARVLFVWRFLKYGTRRRSPIKKSAGFTSQCFNDWTYIGNDVNTTKRTYHAIMHTEINIKPNECDPDEDSEINIKSTSNKEIMEALSNLRRGVQYGADRFESHYDCERFIFTILEASKTQMKIDAFLK